MSLLLPQRPAKLVVAGLAGWAGLTLLANLPDQDTRGGRVLHDGLATGAAAFSALALGGGLLEFWQRREWRRRTQWIPFDLLDRSMRELANLVSEVVDLVTPLTGHPSNVPLATLTLPWSSVRERAIAAQERALESAGRLLAADAPASFDQVTQSQRGVAAGLDNARAALEAHADKVWATAIELGPFIDDRHGPGLLTSVSALHEAVRKLVDPFPGTRIPEPIAALSATLSVGDVLTSSATVAASLNDAYLKLQNAVTLTPLRERLENERRRGAATDKAISEQLNAKEEQEAIVAEFKRAREDFGQAGVDLLRAVREALDSPDTDEDTLRAVLGALDEAGEIADDQEAHLGQDSSPATEASKPEPPPGQGKSG